MKALACLTPAPTPLRVVPSLGTDLDMETAQALQESLAVAAFEQTQLPGFRRQASVKDGLGWSDEAPNISSIPKEGRQRDAILRYFKNLRLTDCSIEVR